jgi:hypothetical protein
MTLKKSGVQPDFFVAVGFGWLIKPGTIWASNRNGNRDGVSSGKQC